MRSTAMNADLGLVLGVTARLLTGRTMLSGKGAGAVGKAFTSYQ
jgi:hypothetical protein